MAVQYELVKNYLGKEPKGYHAIVANHKVHDREELIEMMLNRGTSLTKPDIKAALTCFDETVSQIIKDGEGLNTGLFTIHLNIKGKFPNVNSHFDRSVNSLAINMNANKSLKVLLGEVEVERVHSSGRESKITAVEDILSHTRGQFISPKGPFKVFGSRIKIAASAAADDKEGLYAVSLNTGTAYKFGEAISNMPSELIYLAPALAAGTYKIEVRTYYGSSGISKRIKTIAFDRTLTVT